MKRGSGLRRRRAPQWMRVPLWRLASARPASGQGEVLAGAQVAGRRARVRRAGMPRSWGVSCTPLVKMEVLCDRSARGLRFARAWAVRLALIPYKSLLQILYLSPVGRGAKNGWGT